MESQLRQSHNASKRDNSLFGSVIVDVVQHMLHALPLRVGQVRATILRRLGGRHRSGAGTLVAFLGWHGGGRWICAGDATGVGASIGIESFTFDAPLVNREPLRLP